MTLPAAEVFHYTVGLSRVVLLEELDGNQIFRIFVLLFIFFPGDRSRVALLQ